jgi:aminoglycoside 3-N-acetyltransferase
MHAVEEHVEPPYLYAQPLLYHIRFADGSEGQMTVRRHNFAGVRQRYDRLEAVMDGKGIRKGRVLQADCHLIETEAMWPAALAAYRRDPLFFVEPEA